MNEPRFDIRQGMVYPIGLSDFQKNHYESIRWLISDRGRASGRSYLMALAYIDKALFNEGEWVIIRDHHPSLQNDEFLMRQILSLTAPFHEKIRVSAKKGPPRIRIEHALDVQVTEKEL